MHFIRIRFVHDTHFAETVTVSDCTDLHLDFSKTTMAFMQCNPTLKYNVHVIARFPLLKYNALRTQLHQFCALINLLSLIRRYPLKVPQGLKDLLKNLDIPLASLFAELTLNYRNQMFIQQSLCGLLRMHFLLLPLSFTVSLPFLHLIFKDVQHVVDSHVSWLEGFLQTLDQDVLGLVKLIIFHIFGCFTATDQLESTKVLRTKLFLLKGLFLHLKFLVHVFLSLRLQEFDFIHQS